MVNATAHMKAAWNATASATFAIAGDQPTALVARFIEGVSKQMSAHGHPRLAVPEANTRLVFNVNDACRPRPFRRRAQATFVSTVIEWPEPVHNALEVGYPILVRSLANLVVIVSRPRDHSRLVATFITPERGHYSIESASRLGDPNFFMEVYQAIEPLASARLIINNIFKPDLEAERWYGDEQSRELANAGQCLASRKLLEPAFPVAQVLSPTDLRHLKRLFGLGGLSYGNLSVRTDDRRFWMSARGVDKGNLQQIGRDILMISAFDAEAPAMIISVPPHVEPRRASVDAIEHWTIYQQHPDVGAIVHLHTWMAGIRSTQTNYPCGTIELAEAVADLLREEDDPANAVIGLKNHGITITGRSMPEIMRRIEQQELTHVPMP